MTPHPLRDRRVLVVEDEYFLAMHLKRDLAAVGAVVVGPVASVADALALIASEPNIDAAVLDVNLRGEFSYPVADALLLRGVPIVLTTGYADGELDTRFPKVPRCEKPLEFQTLEQALIAALETGPQSS